MRMGALQPIAENIPVPTKGNIVKVLKLRAMDCTEYGAGSGQYAVLTGDGWLMLWKLEPRGRGTKAVLGAL
jgi:hypothetical protein